MQNDLLAMQAFHFIIRFALLARIKKLLQSIIITSNKTEHNAIRLIIIFQFTIMLMNNFLTTNQLNFKFVFKYLNLHAQTHRYSDYKF